MYAKVSINPKSDMQTLKVHKDLFKKGYGTKGDIYGYCWLILEFRAAAQRAAAAVGVEDGVFS